MIVLVLSSNAYSGDVWNEYLKTAEGDTLTAITNMENDYNLFVIGGIALEKDLKNATSRGDRYAKQFDEERGSWFDRLWDSEVVKTLIFIAGVWLGIYAGK